MANVVVRPFFPVGPVLVVDFYQRLRNICAKLAGLREIWATNSLQCAAATSFDCYS